MPYFRFQSKEEVMKFLEKYDFRYKIPELPEDFFYEVGVGIYSDSLNILDYAKIKKNTNEIYHLAGRYFYDRKEMTVMQFGIKRERFKLLKNTEEAIINKITGVNKNKRWNGGDFRDWLDRNSENTFNKISIGKDSIKISIQGGNYFKSEPREIVNSFDYEAFEVAFFKKSEMIFDKNVINELFENFNRKDELYKLTKDGIIFEYVPRDLIQDTMLHLKYNEKRKKRKNKESA